jgi:hypothetical protein
MVEDEKAEILNTKIRQEVATLRYIDGKLFYEDENPRGLLHTKRLTNAPKLLRHRTCADPELAAEIAPPRRPRSLPKVWFPLCPAGPKLS